VEDVEQDEEVDDGQSPAIGERYTSWEHETVTESSVSGCVLIDVPGGELDAFEFVIFSLLPNITTFVAGKLSGGIVDNARG